MRVNLTKFQTLIVKVIISSKIDDINIILNEEIIPMERIKYYVNLREDLKIIIKKLEVSDHAH